LWEGSLNEAKQIQESRFLDTKRNTISQFRVTDGTGFVKKRIGEWEELIVLVGASFEQLETTIRAAIINLLNSTSSINSED